MYNNIKKTMATLIPNTYKSDFMNAKKPKKKEAFVLFEGLLKKIKVDVIKLLLNLNIVVSSNEEKSEGQKKDDFKNFFSTMILYYLDKMAKKRPFEKAFKGSLKFQNCIS